MVRRAIIGVVLLAGLFSFTACSNKRVVNPIANVDSKQPDKVLFDRAMEAMKKNKFEAARLALQTLINTYPDSEFVARAKLSIADSWYAEGGSAAWQQAEAEYLDFQTFFPNMPEAAEAQLKVANIHYQQMEKPDRDFTHAKRAEDEYRKLLMNYPDNQQLVPLAKKRLLEVQEVLAEREYRIGRFYFLRESWPAAIARLKSVSDAYPLYSGADEVLYTLGSAYEREIGIIRATPSCSATIKKNCMNEAAKGRLINQYEKDASEAYSKILTRYPVMQRSGDAKARLEALKKPVPTATPEMIAQNKAEEESRGERGTWSKIGMNFVKRPDMSQATKVGDPTLTDPKQTNATDIVKTAMNTAAGTTSSAKVGAEVVSDGSVPANQPIPRSDDQPAPAAGSSDGAVTPEQTNTNGATNGNTEGIGELVPNADSGSADANASGAATVTSTPAGSTAAPTAAPTPTTPNPAPEAAPASGATANTAEQTPTPPTPVNDAATSTSTQSSAAQADTSKQSDQGVSSSKGKKKKKVWPF